MSSWIEISARRRAMHELNDTPYKYFHKWEYDNTVFSDLNWVEEKSINDERNYVLKVKATDYADTALDVVNWIFIIYLAIYIINSARHWLYKK